MLKGNRFTMEFVEQQYQHSIQLYEQLERAAEALKVFQDKMAHDQEIISTLRNQIEELKAGAVSDIDWKSKYEEEVATRRNLQEKLQKFKQLLQYNPEEPVEEPEQTKPKVYVPKLALGSPLRISGSTSPTVALRSKSSPDMNNLDDKAISTSQIPLVLNQDQDYGMQDDRSASGIRRRNTIANLKPFDPPLDLSIPQDALSQCRLCGCDIFRATQKAGWICLCGHTSIKHSNIAYKISPRGLSPRSSPRSYVGL
jgi:hypothetical protein